MGTFRKLAVFLFLFLLLTASWQASAAGPRAGSHKSAKAKPARASLVTSAWVLALEVWTKAGCVIDPDGRCAPAPAPLNQVDNGCSADPSGRCRS